MQGPMGIESRTVHVFLILVLGSILGLGQSTRLGNGHRRVETFLLSALKDATKTKYEHAMQLLSRELARVRVSWRHMDEAEQDFFLADWMVETASATTAGSSCPPRVAECHDGSLFCFEPSGASYGYMHLFCWIITSGRSSSLTLERCSVFFRLYCALFRANQSWHRAEGGTG